MSHNDAETALLAGFLCLAVAAAGDGSSARASARVPEQSPPAGLIERGRYLVHNVAMCVQCHSPRDENGELIETALLTGAPMPVKSPFPNRIWRQTQCGFCAKESRIPESLPILPCLPSA